MSSLQSQHHQAAFNSLKINLKYCKFQINFNCMQMGQKPVSSEIKWQVIGMARTFEKPSKPGNLPRTSLTCRVLGDHPKLSNHDKSGIFRMSRENPRLSYKKLAQIFNESKNNPKVSRELVRQTLLDKGIGTYIAARKPILSITDKCKQRVWSKVRLDWSVEQWAKVIWSDEANFQVINVKRFAAEEYSDRFLQHRQQGGGGSVGIWGCFSHKGIGFCELYEGRINQYTYQNTLETCLVPSIRHLYGRSKQFIFQQDGASAHTGHSIKEYFLKKKFNVMPWCPRSPDLNPIENIWSWFDNQLTYHEIQSTQHLKQLLNEYWLKVLA